MKNKRHYSVTQLSGIFMTKLVDNFKKIKIRLYPLKFVSVFNKDLRENLNFIFSDLFGLKIKARQGWNITRKSDLIHI